MDFKDCKDCVNSTDTIYDEYCYCQWFNDYFEKGDSKYTCEEYEQVKYFPHLNDEERNALMVLIYRNIDECLEQDDLQINGRCHYNYIDILKYCSYTSDNQPINRLNVRIDGNKLADNYEQLLRRQIIKAIEEE